MLIDKRISNSIWMASEKTLQIAGLFIVTAAMARYIGAYYYGVISYYTSAISLIYIVCALGADPIIMKKGSVNVKVGINRAVAISIIRTFLFIVLSIVFLLYSLFFNKINDFTQVVFFGSILISQLLISVDFFSLVNNFTLKSKVNTIANVLGLFLALSLRSLFVKYNAPVYWFALPILLSPSVSLAFKLASFKWNIDAKFLISYFSGRRLKVIVNVLKPFAITNISANFYLKLPALSISYYLGYASVGIYSCGLSIASTWVFVPLSIISSFIPKYYSDPSLNSKEYLAKLLGLIIIICLSCSLLIYSLSGYVIELLYGQQYKMSEGIVAPILLSSSLSMIATVLYHYLIKFKAYGFIMSRTLMCAVLSIPLTLALTSTYGLYGAVYSLVIIELFSLIFCNLFYDNGILLKLIFKSLSPATIRNLNKI